MTLTDAQRFYVMLRDAGPSGVHSHRVRHMGLSGNPSQRAKDIASHGVEVWTARENRGKRPGSRYWLGGSHPDWAVLVKPNRVEPLAYFRDYTDPKGTWKRIPVSKLERAA